MIRNLKALGLLAVAALAMSAMFASSAQAQSGVFTAGLTPGTHTTTNLHGELYGTTNVFETPNSTIGCENSGVTFTASVPGGTATQIIVTPTYKDCNAGGLPMTVTMNGCTYTFKQPTSVAGSHVEWTGKVDLVCPAGQRVVMHVYLGGTMTAHNTLVCTITVLPAINLSHVIYKNIVGAGGKKDDVTIQANVTGTAFEEHGAFCPDGNTVNGIAAYTGTVTVTGKDANSNQHDVWISTHK